MEKVLLAGGGRFQTFPHRQMLLAETAPVTSMDREHFTHTDIFWMICGGLGNISGGGAPSWQTPQRNHQAEVNINWPDVGTINYGAIETLLLRK